MTPPQRLELHASHSRAVLLLGPQEITCQTYVTPRLGSTGHLRQRGRTGGLAQERPDRFLRLRLGTPAGREQIVRQLQDAGLQTTKARHRTTDLLHTLLDAAFPGTAGTEK